MLSDGANIIKQSNLNVRNITIFGNSKLRITIFKEYLTLIIQDRPNFFKWA